MQSERSKSDTKPNEHHEERSQGRWFPNAIWQKLDKAGCITLEMKLYSLVWALCKNGECYASNSWLAAKLGTSARSVQRAVNKGLKIGILQLVGPRKGGRGRSGYRRMRTVWNDPVGEGNHDNFDMASHDSPVMAHSLLRKEHEYKKASNADRADAGRHEEDDMAGELDGFPPAEEETPRARKVVLQQAQSLAALHRKFCAAKGWRISKDHRNWEQPFASLVRNYGYADVKERLLWYHANWDRDESRRDKFHKVLYHGKEFLRSYPDLVKVMDLINKEKAQYDVKLDRKLKGVAETVRSWGWPTKAKGQIDAAVQLTFDALTEFQSRLKTYCKNNPKKPGLVGHHDNFAHHLLDVIGGFGPYGGVKGLTESWLEKVHTDKAGWSDWNQELVRCVPKPGLHDKKFNEWGRQVADEWSSARIWDKLMGYLYPHKE